MGKNLFAPAPEAKGEPRAQRAPGPRGEGERRGLTAPDYTASPCTLWDRAVFAAAGIAEGVEQVAGLPDPIGQISASWTRPNGLRIERVQVPLGVLGGLAAAAASLIRGERRAVRKRLLRLRGQFYDLLEAMSVSMRAGNPVWSALGSARDDLTLIYPEDSDIVVELDIILAKFENAIPLSQSFADFAARSGLEDVASFASIYATIEGKSSRADEIVRETQQIIADKMEIEMEIETLMTAAKSEVAIMLVMPLVILAVVGYAGAGFMDAIYTTFAGRVVATGGLIVFVISFFLAQRFSEIKL